MASLNSNTVLVISFDWYKKYMIYLIHSHVLLNSTWSRSIGNLWGIFLGFNILILSPWFCFYLASVAAAVKSSRNWMPLSHQFKNILIIANTPCCLLDFLPFLFHLKKVLNFLFFLALANYASPFCILWHNCNAF